MKPLIVKEKKIAIIEIYSHHLYVHTLASSLISKGHKVTVYVTQTIFKDLEPLFIGSKDIPEFVISKDNENDLSFLRRIKLDIDASKDLLIINSIQGYRVGFFYIVKFSIPTIAAAGRISEFFGSSYRLRGFFSVREIIHHNYTKLFLSRIIKRLDGIIVHTEQARQNALENGYTKPIHLMPFSLYLGREVIKPNKSTLEVLVTGQIVERARDYFALLNAFESLWLRGYSKIRLTVLSYPITDYGYSIIEEMQRLESKGYPIKFFTKWIPELEFIENTSKAQFIIAPILKDYYNQGELTSVHVESVRMGIPAIYPDWYKPDPNIISSSIYFKNYNELENILIRLVENPKQIESISYLAVQNAKHYSLANVSEELDKFIQEV